MFKHRAVTCESFTEGTDSFILGIGLFLFNAYGLYPTGQAPTLGIGTQKLNIVSALWERWTRGGSLSGDLRKNLTNCSEGDAVCRGLVREGNGSPGPQEWERLHTGAASPGQQGLKDDRHCQVGNCGEGSPGGGNCMCKSTEMCSETSEQFIAAGEPSVIIALRPRS